MKKTLLIAVVLLTLTLPTVLANPHYSYRTVTFDGDIEGSANDVKVWDPSSKIVIEPEYGPINLTFRDRGDEEGSDWNKTADVEWDDFEDLSQNWVPDYENYFGKLYLRVFKNKGEATIKYWFSPIDKTWDPYGRLFRYRLVGSGTWSGERIEVKDKTFTISNVTYIEKKRSLKTKFDPLWEGRLTFNITIEEV